MKIELKHFGGQNKRKQLGGTEKQRLLNVQCNACFYCGIKFGEWVTLRKKLRMLKPVFDHLMPYAYCYNNNIENMVAACAECNAIKSDKVFDTIEKAIQHVRERRREKGLPLFKLYGTVSKKEEVAKVLLTEVSNRLFLEAPRSCEEMSDGELEQRRRDIAIIRADLKAIEKGASK